jgi:hypothetical protein
MLALPPAVPLTFQVTGVFLPEAFAVNCWVLPGFRVADIGTIAMDAGLEEPPQEISKTAKKTMISVLTRREYRMTNPDLLRFSGNGKVGCWRVRLAYVILDTELEGQW